MTSLLVLVARLLLVSDDYNPLRVSRVLWFAPNKNCLVCCYRLIVRTLMEGSDRTQELLPGADRRIIVDAFRVTDLNFIVAVVVV